MGDQARRPMHEELLAISGIASAEFEGDPEAPEGVRVQLAPGADPEFVGREVSRVLAGHGMRSHLTAPSVAPQTPPPPPEPRTVVNLADFDHNEPSRDAPVGESATGPGPVESARETPEPVEPAAGEEASPESAAEAAEGSGYVQASSALPRRLPVVDDVSISQRSGSLTVSVGVGGSIVERRAADSERGIDLALLAGLADLLGVAPVPTLVSVTTTDQGGTEIVSVLLDDGLAQHAGSAVVRGNRAWAVARALWAALSAQV